MKKLKGYIKELLSLVNTTELSAEQINRMKDLVCFLSEKKKACSATEEEKKRLEYILYSASVRMRTFGYNRLNSFSAEKINTDVISQIKDDCVADYYKTETGYVLDKQQKAVLDYFEQHQGRLFLSAPTSFGKTFLLQEIIYRHYDSFDNIVIVLPTVALLMEVTDDLSSFCKKNSLEYTFVNSVYRDLEIGEKNIFILTPERVLRLLALYPDLEIQFFFYDEIYKIDEDIASQGDDDINEAIDIGNTSISSHSKNDKHRAVAFRLALYFLLKKANFCYIAGPFINLQTLKSGFVNMLKKHNIAPLEIHFEPTLKNKYYYTGKTLTLISPFENDKVITQSNTKEERLNYIIGYLGVSEHNQAIIYCLYPGYTETYAKNYCATLQEPIFPKQETLLFIEHLKANYGFFYGGSKKNSLDDWSFLYALEHNVGIHNGKFPKYFQREVMNLYNLKQLPVLFCTSTIVEGVNTNAKTVILYNNPSGDNDSGKKFLLLNINGRAGRYLRHFVGNIVYLDVGSKKIETVDSISLDFKLYSDDVLLEALDLESVDEKDLSSANKARKVAIVLDKWLLPDAVFEQNRLIERKKQEKILRKLCEPKIFYRLYGIERASISQFMSQYFEIILGVWASVGEIQETQIEAIKYFAQNYAQNGYPGVLKYKFDNYAKFKVADQTDSDFVNDTYKEVFRNVKDTIEYQLPRILSLFETLINRAYELKNRPLANPLDLSKIIRYFEIGAQTELGIDMIERGVPIITVRKIEKRHIVGETLSLQKGYVKENISRFLFDLDDYEKHLLKKYLDDHA